VLRSKQPLPPLLSVREDDVVKDALDMLRRYEISQLPVMSGDRCVGSINDVAVMQAVFDQQDVLHEPVSGVMGRAFPALEDDADIDRAYKLLSLANSAILVLERGKPAGVVTRQDIISFLSAGNAAGGARA
jgi:cystathionine beta-synthase